MGTSSSQRMQPSRLGLAKFRDGLVPGFLTRLMEADEELAPTMPWLPFWMVSITVPIWGRLIIRLLLTAFGPVLLNDCGRTLACRSVPLTW